MQNNQPYNKSHVGYFISYLFINSFSFSSMYSLSSLSPIHVLSCTKSGFTLKKLITNLFPVIIYSSECRGENITSNSSYLLAPWI